MKFKVIIPDHRFPNLNHEREILEPINAEVIDAKISTPEELISKYPDADALIIRHMEITEETLKKLPKCKVVARYGVGFDNFDVDGATRQGVYMANVTNYCTEEVAGLALSYLMFLNRKLNIALRVGPTQNWSLEPLGKIRRLSTQTVGIVGFGRIGKCFARMVVPLGARVIAYDPYISVESSDMVQGVNLVDKDTLLRESDYISFHAPLSKDTKDSVGKKEYEIMKDGVCLINVARGGILNEIELGIAINNGKVRAACLDVLTSEPPETNHPLLNNPNVFISPHIAYLSEESKVDLQKLAAKEVARVLTGNKPLNLINANITDIRKL